LEGGGGHDEPRVRGGGGENERGLNSSKKGKDRGPGVSEGPEGGVPEAFLKALSGYRVTMH